MPVEDLLSGIFITGNIVMSDGTRSIPFALSTEVSVDVRHEVLGKDKINRMDIVTVI